MLAIARRSLPRYEELVRRGYGLPRSWTRIDPDPLQIALVVGGPLFPLSVASWEIQRPRSQHLGTRYPHVGGQGRDRSRAHRSVEPRLASRERTTARGYSSLPPPCPDRVEARSRPIPPVQNRKRRRQTYRRCRRVSSSSSIGAGPSRLPPCPWTRRSRPRRGPCTLAMSVTEISPTRSGMLESVVSLGRSSWDRCCFSVFHDGALSTDRDRALSAVEKRELSLPER